MPEEPTSRGRFAYASFKGEPRPRPACGVVRLSQRFVYVHRQTVTYDCLVLQYPVTVISCYLGSMSKDHETLAERFTRLIEEAGIPASEVARVMGLSEGMVYKIRRGDVKQLSLVAALRLCRRMNVSPYYLAGEPEPGATPQSVPVSSDYIAKFQRLEERVDALSELPLEVAALAQAVKQLIDLQSPSIVSKSLRKNVKSS